MRGKKSLAAGSAASKTKQLSTATSKLKEAARYEDLQAKHLVEVAKLEKKIAAEQKKLARRVASKSLVASEAFVLPSNCQAQSSVDKGIIQVHSTI